MSPPEKKMKVGDVTVSKSGDNTSCSIPSTDVVPQAAQVNVVFGDDDLLEVKLTEEEEKLLDGYGSIFDFSSDSDHSDESIRAILPPWQTPLSHDDSFSMSSLCSSNTGSPNSSPRSDSSAVLSLPPTKGSLIRFLISTPTNKWNERDNSAVFFRLFRVSACIVHPNHFVAKFHAFEFEELEIDNLLISLEKKKSNLGVAWSSLELSVKEFLGIYTDGLENLADVYGDKQLARQYITPFRRRIQKVQQEAKYTSSGEYSPLLLFTSNLQVRNGTAAIESDFVLYTKSLIDFIRIRLGTLLFSHGTDLKLSIPAYRECPSVEKDVRPDIVLLCPKSSQIMLVGEVKTFGSHGRKFESHKGRKLKKESIDENCDGNTGPVPGTSTGCTGSPKLKNAKGHSSTRDLDNGEKYKVSCYLPQLLGQMLTAMQVNKDQVFELGSRDENVQFGFAVEGFKLRLVKLVLRDYNQELRPPYIEELLDGRCVKCKVYMTQEFNLLKKHHVEMFFQVLLAISYLFGGGAKS